MAITRRSFVLFSLCASAQQLLGQQQGIATRDVKAQAKPAPSGRPFNAHFTDVAKEAGLHMPVIYGGVDSKKYIMEANGCGCAFIDYDNDGWMDIFLLSGTRLEGDPPEATNRLYKNNRDGTFTDVTEKAGLQGRGLGEWRMRWRLQQRRLRRHLLHLLRTESPLSQQRRRHVHRCDQASRTVGAGSGAWGAGCAFLDYNRDGHLDLFVSNYIRFSFEHAPAPGENSTCNWKGIPVNCGPRGLPTGRHSLYRNNGDGTFTDVTKQAGIAAATESYGMTVVTADFDEDGWPDIFVACDSTPSLLFMNNHDGTFREEGVMRGVALSDDGMEQAGMGVGIGDYNLDGHLDLFKTHFIGDTSGFYRNDGKGNFDEVTRLAKVGVETRFTSWGAGIVDLDNDGYPDVFFVTGSVYPEVERKLPQYPYKTPRVLFRNLGNGTFEELDSQAGEGITDAAQQPGMCLRRFRQ